MTILDEAEANLFAIELLMPRHIVFEWWDKAQEIPGNDKPRIAWMAEEFEVSREMMAARLVQLGERLDVA